eukprot:5178-Rhodomonas_salina.2
MRSWYRVYGQSAKSNAKNSVLVQSVRKRLSMCFDFALTWPSAPGECAARLRGPPGRGLPEVSTGDVVGDS